MALLSPWALVLPLLFAAPPASTPDPCDQAPLSVDTGGGSSFCVVLALDPSGKVAIVPESSRFHANASYNKFTTGQKNALQAAWNTLIGNALAQQPPLWKAELTNTERDEQSKGTLPAATQAEIAALQHLPRDLTAARPALARFARCPEGQKPCQRIGPDQAVDQTVKPIVNAGFLNASPLSNPQIPQPVKTVWFTVDDLIQDFTKITIEVKPAQAPLQPASSPITADWIRSWLADEQKSRVWIAADIRQRLTDILSGLGLQPAVMVSGAGVSPPHVTVELGLVHIIQMPGDLDPANASGKTEILKILNILLTAEDYSAALGRSADFSELIPQAGAPPLLFRRLDISTLRRGQGLHFLDLFEFSGQQADLQTAGYVANTEAESADNGFATTYILNVARPAAQAPVSAPSAPKAAIRGATKQVATSAQALPALQANPVTAVNPGMPLPALALPPITYGAGVEYRPGQGARPLVSLSTGALTTFLGQMSLRATGGADSTRPVATLAIHNDYVAFGKLNHRLSFDFSGMTDSTADRLIGSKTPVNQQRTGGKGELDYYPLREWHGASVQLFGTGARENVVFTRTGAAIPHFTVWTADAGATVDLIREARILPGRFEFTPRAHFGWDLSPGTKPYRIWSLDVLGHQRVSDRKLISLDFAGHFRDASGGAPIYELPSLGGGDSLRGFRADDILAQRFWALQTELWIPVPGTLSALPGETGFAAVERFLQQNIRIAFFVDAGGGYGIPQSAPSYFLTGVQPSMVADGVRWGPGAGIRFIRGNFALKLDWAYGRGRGQSGAGHGREYLGVVQNGAF